ncbi:hypothetical protein BOX15_Mlig005073g1 [Macrostomum lignano]|uniref:EGF-like domain-containing protein n=1 Tax=Macrostomum lignano TaxID=282301 RepID=A0A267EEG8_9PLAT|nr:hypothetical protein BOX15_Mlig005073g1 [Macrostomum lignano]
MMKLTASLLLVHIVLLCPTTPTPVTMMKRSRAEAEPKLEGDSLNERMQRELQANKQRVLKILEGREWYRAFLELLRNELKKKADHRIEVAKIYMRTADPARVRRSVEQDFEEALSRAARSVPAREDSRVEVSAALKVDGKVCLNVTKKAEAIRLGDSNEIIKADIGNTEILLSMKVTKKGAATEDEALAQPPVPLHRASNDAVVRGRISETDAEAAAAPNIRLSAAERTPPSPPPTTTTPSSTPRPTVRATSISPTTARPPPPPPPPPPRSPPSDADFDSAAAAVATAHAAIAAAKSANASRSGGLEQPWHGDYSQLQSHCTDRNYCLFGGTCVYYGIIELPLCNCRKGYKGNRCELYDINEVLSTLDSAHKRRVIGNGPIEQQGDHMDVLSVVESTAIYLLHVPKSYPSPQAMQWIQSILLSR